MKKPKTDIDIHTLRGILKDTLKESDAQTVLEEIAKKLVDDQKAAEGEEEAPPKPKKKTVVLVTGLPQGTSAKDISELPGFVLDMPEDESASEIPGKLLEIAACYAQTRKAKKLPSKTVGELWENAPASLWKQQGIAKKSKTIVEFFFADNTTSISKPF